MEMGVCVCVGVDIVCMYRGIRVVWVGVCVCVYFDAEQSAQDEHRSKKSM